MQLANNLSVLSSTLSSTLGYGGGGSYDDGSGGSVDLASPVRQEDEDDSEEGEPMLSGRRERGDDFPYLFEEVCNNILK